MSHLKEKVVENKSGKADLGYIWKAPSVYVRGLKFVHKRKPKLSYFSANEQAQVIAQVDKSERGRQETFILLQVLLTQTLVVGIRETVLAGTTKGTKVKLSA